MLHRFSFPFGAGSGGDSHQAVGTASGMQGGGLLPPKLPFLALVDLELQGYVLSGLLLSGVSELRMLCALFPGGGAETG